MSVLRISTLSALILAGFGLNASSVGATTTASDRPQFSPSDLGLLTLSSEKAGFNALDNNIAEILESGHLIAQDGEMFPLNSPVLLSQDSSSVTGDTFSSQNAKKSLLIDPLVLPSSGKSPQASPGSTFGVPSAYGASWRSVFVGGGLIGPGEFSTPQGDQDVDTDGSISFGAGFGDSVKTIGVELDFAIISLRDAFADSGSVGFKVHKVFPELDNLAVAVGWTNPITWGDADDAEETVYGVLTKAFELRPGKSNTLPLTVTTGIGTGAFRSTGAIDAGTNDPNFFGSLGLKVIPQVSLISTWSGNQLNMGVSAAPFPQVPFTLTLGAGDVTNNRGNGTRFLMSGGFGFKF